MRLVHADSPELAGESAIHSTSTWRLGMDKPHRSLLTSRGAPGRPADDDGDAVVVDREFFGHDQLVTVSLPGGTLLRSRSGPSPIVKPSDRVWVKVGDVTTFPA